jgi:hypothetical protein
MGQHVPSRPTCLHDTHAPWQATLQQRPSAQNPDAQSAFFAQRAPRGLGPQLPATHLMPFAQSPSVMHAVAHWLVEGSQPKGAQTVSGPGLQRPPESQTKTPPTCEPSQAPGLQTVPGAYLRHAPAPLHVPSRPQLETSPFGHTAAARGAEPLGTNEHVPGAAVVLQALHVSAHAVLQQRPSTQKPLTHSSPQPQACPLAFFIAPAPLQLAGVASGSASGGEAPFPPQAASAHTTATTSHDFDEGGNPTMALPKTTAAHLIPCASRNKVGPAHAASERAAWHFF